MILLVGQARAAFRSQREAAAAIGMTPGSHGSTYGSNPLSMAVGHAVLDILAALPEGSAPATGQVAGANTIRIGAAVDARSGQATVISAIDNLVKGTAGAALQSMNLALGLPEATGLVRTALAP